MFQKIQSSYEILSSKELRATYDKEYIQQIHTEKQRQSPKGSKTLGRNLLYQLPLPLNEAFSGTKRKIKYIHLFKGQKRESTVEVTIPAGVQDQRKLRVRGAGESASPDQKPGDLIIVVHWSPPLGSQIVEHDLFLTVPLSPEDLIKKSSVPISPLGESIEVPFPAEFKKNHMELRFKNKGLWNSEQQTSRGDLIAQFVIEVPPKRAQN